MATVSYSLKFPGPASLAFNHLGRKVRLKMGRTYQTSDPMLIRALEIQGQIQVVGLPDKDRIARRAAADRADIEAFAGATDIEEATPPEPKPVRRPRGKGKATAKPSVIRSGRSKEGSS